MLLINFKNGTRYKNHNYRARIEYSQYLMTEFSDHTRRGLCLKNNGI